MEEYRLFSSVSPVIMTDRILHCQWPTPDFLFYYKIILESMERKVPMPARLKLPTVPAGQLVSPMVDDQCPLLKSTQSIRYTQTRIRGKKLKSMDGPKIQCGICRNPISASRLANLHNHARRHSHLKQFHCPCCSYTHTELAKVRLHIKHNHDYEETAGRSPVDKRNEEMEKSWADMLKQCFPDYA